MVLECKKSEPELDYSPEQLLLDNNDLILESDNQTQPPYEWQYQDLTLRPNLTKNIEHKARSKTPPFPPILETLFECHSMWQWPKFFWSVSAIWRKFRLSGRGACAQKSLLWICKIIVFFWHVSVQVWYGVRLSSFGTRVPRLISVICGTWLTSWLILFTWPPSHCGSGLIMT